MSDLLPCPWCGKTDSDGLGPEIYMHRSHGGEPDDTGCFIICGCGASFDDAPQTREQAIAAWNTRADHLASSGPAGEEHTKLVRLLTINAEAGWKAHDAARAELASRDAVIDGYQAETLAAQQECEAQKARAIRAEGERDDAEAQCASAERELNELDLSSTAEIARLQRALAEIFVLTSHSPDANVQKANDIIEALTPAPDHAKGELPEWSVDRIYNCKQCQTPLPLPGYCVNCQDKP